MVAYGTEEDMRQLSVGAKVSIGETASGVVTKVASALDPRTKKIEIPISALKITPQGSFVFTVVESTSTPYEGVLVSHKVTEGALLGDKIQILEGVTPEMILVTDVRGLQAGKTVTIAE